MKIIKIELKKEGLSKPNIKILGDSIKQEGGVYLLFNKEKELLYIGKTLNLRNRLLQHLSPRNNGRKNFHNLEFSHNTPLPIGIVKYYAFLPIDNERERSITETMLIFSLNSKFNKTQCKEE